MRLVHQLAFVLVTVGPGCTPRHRFMEAPLEPGDLAVTAVVSASGEVVGVSSSRVPPDGPPALNVRVDLEADDRLIVWPIKPAEVWLSPDFAPLSEAMLNAVSARLSSAESNGCGRCLAPSPLPQLVFPGDLCPVPPVPAFADGERLEPEATAAMRTSILLAWPGECACGGRAIEEPAPESTELELLLPTTEPEVFSAFTLAPDESAGFFTPGLALRVDRGGQRVERRWTPQGPDGPYDTMPLAAAGVNQGFVVAVQGERSTSMPLLAGSVDLVVLNHALEVIGRADDVLSEVYELRFLPARDLLLVSGKRWSSGFLQQQIAALLVCRIETGVPRCASLLPAEGFVRDGSVRSLAVTESGVLVAEASIPDGTLLLLDRVPSPDEILEVVGHSADRGEVRLVDGSTIGYAATDLVLDGNARALGTMQIEALGDRIFVCGRRRNDPTLELVLASAPATRVEGSAEMGALQLHACRAAESCDLFPISDRILRASMHSKGYVDVEIEGGRVVRPEPPLTCPTEETLPRLPDDLQPDVVRAAPAGATRAVARDDAGRYWFLRAEEPPVHLYGGLERHAVWRGLVVRGEEIWSFDGGTAWILTPSSAETSTRALSNSLPAWPEAVVYDRWRDVFFAVGERWIWRIEPGTLAATPVVSGVDPPFGYAVRVVSVGPETLLIARPHQPIIARGDQLWPVEIDWDDPRTADVEVAPECGTWLDTGAAGGVGWLVGCQGLVARVFAHLPLPRAERVAFSVASFGQGSRLDATAIHAECADRILVAGGVSSGDTPLFEAVGPSFAFTRWSGNRSAQPTFDAPATKVFRFGRDVWLLRSDLASTRTAIERYGADVSVRFEIGDGVLGAVFNARGDLAVSTRHHRLFLGRSR